MYKNKINKSLRAKNKCNILFSNNRKQDMTKIRAQFPDVSKLLNMV